MPDFLPRRDSDLLPWTANLADKLLAEPGTFLVTPERAAAYQALREAFAARLMEAQIRPTRTVVAVAGKEAARAALVEETRAICAKVRVSSAISEAVKVSVGLRSRVTKYRRASRPALPPRIGIVSVDGQTVRVRISDAAKVASRARPAGTTGALLFLHAGETPAPKPWSWKCRGVATKAMADITPGEALPPGTRVWIVAQWMGTRAQLGPMSDPVTVHVGASWVIPKAGPQAIAA